MSVPVVTVTSVDPVLRESAAAGILCDVPDAVVVRHDLLDDPGRLRRVVYDRSGVIEDVVLLLEHVCLSCALREDIVPSLAGIAAAREPGAIVLALPVTAEPLPVVRALGDPSLDGMASAGVLCVFDEGTAEWDLLGDDLLAERGLALHADDRRSVGEALTHQIEYADVLLTPATVTGVTASLLEHLVGATAERMLLHAVDARRLVAGRRGATADLRGDLRTVAPTGAAAREGVWTVDLQSWRPMHPARLLDRIEALGAGPIRGRGHFWLPTRQEVVCAWDGAGGQLSIGDIGDWHSAPDTHLVITGTDRDPTDLVTAFEAVLMTDAELGQDLARWDGREDGFDDWLGARREAA